MKKYYDKVLLLLALILLGAGVGIFFKSGGLPKSEKTPERPLSGGDYTEVTRAASPPPIVEWDIPPDQATSDLDTGWVYFVFTPPKIWWDNLNHRWIPDAPIDKTELGPFALHMVEMNHTYYRLQFTGWQAPPEGGDIKDAILSFIDDDPPGWSIRAKVGDTVAAHQMKVVDFVLEQRVNEHGLNVKVPKVTIDDLATGQTVVLERGVRIVKPGLDYAVLKTEDPLPVQEWDVSKVGETLTLDGNIAFRVLGINFDFDNPSVTVEKRFPFKHNNRTTIQTLVQTLTPVPPDQATPPAAVPAAATPAAGASGDSSSISTPATTK